MHLSGISIMLGLPIHKEESLPEEHSDFIFSIMHSSKQRAEIICEANRNLRLQASYGHPKPSYGHPKPAYVHPKAANGDFTKPRKQFYKGTGRSSEGCQEGCFRLLPPIPRGSACGKEHIKAIITPAFMPSEATCHQDCPYHKLLNFNPLIITPEARKPPNGMASAWGLVLVSML